MLFAQSVEPKDIVTWVLLAVAVLALGGLVAKYISMYLKMKRDKARLDIERQEQSGKADSKLLEISGEYFVMRRDGEYGVGADGQIVQGEYELKSINGGAFTVRLNGQTREFSQDEVVSLAEGETICALTDSVLIKPMSRED